jgi:hypothetical protein
MSAMLFRSLRPRAIDLVVVTLLVVVVMAASLHRSSRVPAAIYEYTVGGQSVSDLWFDGDLPRMYCASTDRFAAQFAITAEHPLLPLMTFVPAEVISQISGASPIDSIRWTVAMTAGLWIAFCFLLLRLMQCRTGDALAFTALAAVSAAGLAWTTVAELHLPGSITLLIPLCLVAAKARGFSVSEFADTAASALSLSVTISNWFSGVGAAFLDRRWPRALQISANGLLIVSALWAALSWWFPEQVYFLGSFRTIEKVVETSSPNPLAATIAFVSHSIVMPAITIFIEPDGSRDLSVQQSLLGSSGWLGIVATALWFVLLGLGIREAMRSAHRGAFRTLLLATVGVQLLLHTVFGRETFLFSIQFAPFLIALAAFGGLGIGRRAVIAVTWTLVLTAGINNWRAIEQATVLATQRIDHLKANPLPATLALPSGCPTRLGGAPAEISADN